MPELESCSLTAHFASAVKSQRSCCLGRWALGTCGRGKYSLPQNPHPAPWGAAAVPAGSYVAVRPFSLRQHSSVCLGVVWLQSCPLTAGTSTGSSRLFSFLLSAGEPGWPCWEPACPGCRLCPHLRALLPLQLPSRCSDRSPSCSVPLCLWRPAFSTPLSSLSFTDHCQVCIFHS